MSVAKKQLLIVVTIIVAPFSVESTKKAGSISQIEVNRVPRVVERVLRWSKIPDEVLEWISILNKHLYLLSCLPTVRNGDCYESSGYCHVEPVKFDGRPIKVHFTVCKSPVKIILKYRIPMPTWAKLLLDVDTEPVVIPFDTKREEGVTTVDSISTVSVGVRGIHFGIAKATLKINAILRWDCTKPNFMQRLQLNTQYTNGRQEHSFNKIYYKLRVRVAFKVKKFPCFCYRCRQCENLVDVQGDVGEGPIRCKTEITDASKWFEKGSPNHGMRVFQRKFPQLAKCLLLPGKLSLARRVYLFTFLVNPKKYEPGKKFVFSGIKKARERADLLAFLKDKSLLCSTSSPLRTRIALKYLSDV